MYPTTRCGLGTATAPQSATACGHAEPSGGESMEEDLRAPAPRKPRNQTSKWDPQDRVGFFAEVPQVLFRLTRWQNLNTSDSQECHARNYAKDR